MKQKHYYRAIYQDGENKVLQISDDVDGLSCEALANTIDCFYSDNLITTGTNYAKIHNCNFLEINTSEKYESHKVS